MLLPRGGHKEALFRHKVREAFEQEKELALARPLALSFSRFVSTPNKTPLKKKKKLASRPGPPPAPLGLRPRRRPARRRALPLQRRQDLPGRRDRSHGCGARLEARDAR